MPLPQHRNLKKYRHRKYSPIAGGHNIRLLDRQIEPEQPFNLDNPLPTFEEWLNEIPDIEDMLAADQDLRILADSGDADYDEDYNDL